MKRTWREALATDPLSSKPNPLSDGSSESTSNNDQNREKASRIRSDNHATDQGPSFQPDVANIRETLPTVTRRVKACSTCRKSKLKCMMVNDEPPCKRCVQRNLSCKLEKSSLDETKQYQVFHNDLVNVHNTLLTVCQRLDLEPPPPLSSRLEKVSEPVVRNAESDRDGDDDADAIDDSPPLSPADRQAPIDTFLENESPQLLHPSPGGQPAESPHGSVSSKKTGAEPDIISQGIVSLAVAEELVNRYLQRLDHFLYGIGSAYTGLKSLRRPAPVLFTAICTISALHEKHDTKLFEVLFLEFQRLISKSLFEKRGVEHLRALCIGAFWLPDASRILNSDALRRIADVHLQKYFYQLTMTESAASQGIGTVSTTVKVDRVRIWYLHYICDQHLSILYNRDPIVHGDQDIILGWEAFLESGHVNDSDIRITSQVALLNTMSQIRTAFGSETAEPVPKALATSFSNYNRQIDQWFARFSPSFKQHPKIGSFPYQGLKLHYHFAKLYLGHHVFRGLNSSPVPTYFIATALTAHAAAISIFDFILNDETLASALVGVPFYFHVMISFAGHFLLSCNEYCDQLTLDITTNLNMIGEAISLFRSIPCIPQHPLNKMTSALERRLYEWQSIILRKSSTADVASGSTMPMQDLQHQYVRWNKSSGIDENLDHQRRTSFNNINQGDFSQDPAILISQTALAYEINREDSMMPPLSSSTVDLDFQNFAGFDFPEMRMGFMS